jgi:hypothetical protein
MLPLYVWVRFVTANHPTTVPTDHWTLLRSLVFPLRDCLHNCSQKRKADHDPFPRRSGVTTTMRRLI